MYIYAVKFLALLGAPYIYEINRLRVKEEFSVAFKKLYERAKACINANGAYFE
jgi:hypothetical protein